MSLAGAIFGLGGAIALISYRNKQLYGKQSDVILQQLGRTLAINLVYGLTSPQIDNW